jgi:plastocyanin
MKRLLPVLLSGCCALVLAAGCGSSRSSSTTSSTTSASTSKANSSGGLKVDTTPKFASAPASAPVKSGVVQIAYRDIAIDPDTVKAKVGSTVRWTNYDPEKCNVASEGGSYKFTSNDFGEGESFELKLSRAGVIHYECTFYPATMNGTIEVVD